MGTTRGSYWGGGEEGGVSTCDLPCGCPLVTVDLLEHTVRANTLYADTQPSQRAVVKWAAVT